MNRTSSPVTIRADQLWPHRFVYTFTAAWTLTWRLEAEGFGTRVFLEHSGFNFDDKRMTEAFERMGPGWRDVILPRRADIAGQAVTPEEDTRCGK